MQTEETIIERLSADIKTAAKTLTATEARYLVDAFYIMQENRIRADAQLRALRETGEPASVLAFIGGQSDRLETRVKQALDIYSAAHPMGEWMRNQKGIGPIIAAGLLAHIDIRKAATAGAIWRFAGLEPTVKWNKGEKRPWNAALKRLCWLIGESFVKVSGDPDALYGQIYAQRKLLEVERNEAGAFAEQAKASLEGKKWDKSTDAYKAYAVGKLPAARLHLRAQRVAVKMFLSHLHEKWYWHEFGKAPPKPYSIDILRHGHYVPAPE